MSDIRFNRWLHQSGTGGVSQDSSGHIGIGTTVPTMALDVRGDVNIGNTININNASGIISATTFTGTTGTFSGNVSAVDGTFTGDVTIAGTLTYEDVSNIDAVGIITAQSDIIVGGGLTVTGISTFNNDVKLLDSDKLKFGIGEDLQIYHDATDSYIDNTGGDLWIRTVSPGDDVNIRSADDITIQTAGGTTSAIFFSNAGSLLHYNGSQKFETTNTGAVVTGILTATTFSGNLTGNVTGDLTGNLAGISSIAAISSSISDTAYDVFVYDTRKDSDGGAWRKRTQHTSWYNETLNTSTRGSRREFPAVAVIVALDNVLRIYDGDDPDLPMWMVFTSADAPGYTGPHLNIASGSTLSAVAALNGEIVVTCNSGSYPFGSVQINFLKDRSLIRPDIGGKLSITNIAKRNVTGSYNANYAYTALVHKFANDVAMTVLPNAPIDDATGLPIPTIAVATDGGVSIIKYDGTVVSKTTTQLYSSTLNSSYYHKNIDISGENAIVNYEYAGGGGHGQLTVVTLNDLTVLRRYGRDYANTTSSHPYFQPLGSRHRHFPKQIYKNNYIFTREQNDSAVNGASDGILTIYEDQSIPSNGLINRISSSYNTGWMHGDIKGAFLSDTDTTNASYTTVADDWATASAWTKQSSISLSSSGSGTSGTVSITGNGTGSNVYFFNPITVEENTDYVVTITFGAYNANDFFINTTQYSTSDQVLDIHGLSGLTRGGHFNSGSNTTLYIQGYQVSTTATTITNVVVQKVSEKDRSVNNKGLQVYGTVTKSAVATGAELVAYNGWSDSNFLRQPYNADLNYGTDDFSVMGWIKMPDISQLGFIFDRASLTTSGGGPRIAIYAESSQLKFYTFNGSSNTEESTSLAGFNNQWVCFVCNRLSNGNQEMYINGELKDNRTGTSRDVSNTASPVTTIGHRYNAAAGATSANIFEGSIALLKTSASIPSAEQVKKMYEEEKVLFQENAKCTLYGSSNAVTTLAYDEDTELLHVGTSAGRSDFQGLRRINNTTTAVTTAISASDELIAEQ